MYNLTEEYMDTKTCPGCKDEKLLEAFARNKHRRDGFQVYCRECKKVTDARRYRADRQAQYDRNTANRNKLRSLINKLKAEVGCRYCSENDPCCLDFHHRGDAEKEADVGALVIRSSRAKLFREIAKCDVVCRNCHAKLHAGRSLAPIAQLVEQQTLNLFVPGSSPGGGTQ